MVIRLVWFGLGAITGSVVTMLVIAWACERRLTRRMRRAP